VSDCLVAEVTLAAGDYALTAALDIRRSLTLRAAPGAAGLVAIDGGGVTNLIIVNEGLHLTLVGLTLRNGFYYTANVNPSSAGVAVRLLGATADVFNCSIVENRANCGVGHNKDCGVRAHPAPSPSPPPSPPPPPPPI
jgi:hypothetical protein